MLWVLHKPCVVCKSLQKCLHKPCEVFKSLTTLTENPKSNAGLGQSVELSHSGSGIESINRELNVSNHRELQASRFRGHHSWRLCCRCSACHFLRFSLPQTWSLTFDVGTFVRNFEIWTSFKVNLMNKFMFQKFNICLSLTKKVRFNGHSSWANINSGSEKQPTQHGPIDSFQLQQVDAFYWWSSHFCQSRWVQICRAI